MPSFFMLNPWKNEFPKFENKHLFNGWFFGKKLYKVTGRNGNAPENGGDGGKGGIGGNHGNIKIACFENRPNFTVVKTKGKKISLKTN